MKNKKKISLICVCVALLLCMTGCGNKKNVATIVDSENNEVKLSYSELLDEKEFNESKFFDKYNNSTITFEDSVESVEENYKQKVSSLRNYQVSTTNIYKTDGTYITGYLIKFKSGWDLFVGKNEKYDELIKSLSQGDLLSVKSKITMLSESSDIKLYSIISPCEEGWNSGSWTVTYTCNYDFDNLNIEKK